MALGGKNNLRLKEIWVAVVVVRQVACGYGLKKGSIEISDRGRAKPTLSRDSPGLK